MNRLEKFKKLSSIYNLEKDNWSTFVVKNNLVKDWNKKKFKYCFLLAAVNVEVIKNIIYTFLEK